MELAERGGSSQPDPKSLILLQDANQDVSCFVSLYCSGILCLVNSIAISIGETVNATISWHPLDFDWVLCFDINQSHMSSL